MKLCLSGFALALLAFNIQTAQASDGWQKTKWGMTIEQVEELYPDSKRILNEDKTKNSSPAFNEHLTILYKTSNRNFDAELNFDAAGKLESVVLQHQYLNGDIYIVSSLTDKYGAPETSSGKEFYALNTWRDGNTMISLWELKKVRSSAGIILYDEDKEKITYRSRLNISNDGL